MHFKSNNNFNISNNKKSLIIGIGISICLMFWLYNPFLLYFLNDDATYIPQSIYFNYVYGSSFRPISDISLLFDYKIFGTKAWGFHLSNLLMHFCCTYLVYGTCKRLQHAFKINHQQCVPFLSAIFFLVYAFHSEAVLWIIGRGALIVTIFTCLSLIFYLDKEKATYNYPLSLLCFGLGLYTYEAIWVLPLIISLLGFTLKRLYEKNVLKEVFIISGYWILFIIHLFVREKVLHNFLATPYTENGFLHINLSKAIYNFCALFIRSFVPPFQNSAVFIVLSGLVLIMLGILLFFLIKHKRINLYRLFVWGAFEFSLLPFVLLGIDTHDSESERFLYLASVFLCIGLADLITIINKIKIQMILIVVWVTIQVICLYNTSSSFKYGSKIAKMTIKKLQEKPLSVDKIYLLDLPIQYKGAFIFRIGIKDALNWLAPNIEYNAIVELSKTEIKRKEKGFHAESVNPDKNVELFNTIYKKVPKQISLNKNNLLLYWQNNCFYLIQFK